MKGTTIAGDMESCLKELRLAGEKHAELCVTARFLFPESYCAFEGHFPVKRILPAIVQLAAVRFSAESALGEPLTPSTLSRVKFKGMVQPEEEIVVELSITEADADWHGIFEIFGDTGELLSSGNITFTKKQ